MKKIFALLLLAFMLVGVFAGCNQNNNQTEKPTNVVDDAILNVVSYTNFRWGVSNENKFRSTSISSTASTDAMEKRYADIQSQYNMTFTIEKIENSPEELTKRILLGKDIWDMVWGTPRKIGYAAYTYTSNEGGVLLALKDIPTIDPDDEKWGGKAFTVAAMFGGVQYGFYPWEWDLIPEVQGCLLFNNEMIEQYVLDNPHELFEQGAWTWANFRKILSDFKERFSNECLPWVTSSINDDVFYMQYTNGNQIVVYDAASKSLKWGWDSAEGLAPLQYMLDLRNDGLYDSGSVHDRFAVSFNSLFASSASSGATNVTVGTSGKVPIASAVKDLGIITMPYGTNGSPETVSASVYWTNDYNFILGNSENLPEAIGYIIDYVFSPLDGRSNWREYADEMIFHKDKDGNPVNLNAYLYMLDRLSYDYSVQLRDTASILDEYGKKVVMGNLSISSFLESCRTVINNDIANNLSVEEYEKINSVRNSGK